MKRRAFNLLLCFMPSFLFVKPKVVEPRNDFKLFVDSWEKYKVDSLLSGKIKQQLGLGRHHKLYYMTADKDKLELQKKNLIAFCAMHNITINKKYHLIRSKNVEILCILEK